MNLYNYRLWALWATPHGREPRRSLLELSEGGMVSRRKREGLPPVPQDQQTYEEGEQQERGRLGGGRGRAVALAAAAGLPGFVFLVAPVGRGGGGRFGIRQGAAVCQGGATGQS